MNAGGVLNTCKANEEPLTEDDDVLALNLIHLRVTEWRTGE